MKTETTVTTKNKSDERRLQYATTLQVKQQILENLSVIFIEVTEVKAMRHLRKSTYFSSLILHKNVIPKC